MPDANGYATAPEAEAALTALAAFPTDGAKWGATPGQRDALLLRLQQLYTAAAAGVSLNPQSDFSQIVIAVDRYAAHPV